MLCNNCHQNEATVHLTQVIEGETTRAALCKTCAEPLTKGSITPQQLLDLVHDSGLREPFSEIAENDQRFSKEAFYFVRDGVNHAVKSLGANHITSAQKNYSTLYGNSPSSDMA